jgi:hypothetical protein
MKSSYCIVQNGGPGHVVWTTEMRFAPVGRFDRREHMLECRYRSWAQTIADRQGGHVVALDDAALGEAHVTALKGRAN